MMLKYAEFVFVYYIHKTKLCPILNAKTVRTNYIKNAYKIGSNPLTKVNVLCAKRITFNLLLLIYIFYNGEIN